jgi:hypothetical protein
MSADTRFTKVAFLALLFALGCGADSRRDVLAPELDVTGAVSSGRP